MKPKPHNEMVEDRASHQKENAGKPTPPLVQTRKIHRMTELRRRDLKAG
jgi:hypothetical protein